MGQGFLLDLAHADSKKLTHWVEGAPERGWFGLLRVRGKRKLTVETWRCERCGFLESFAPAA